MPGQPCSAVNDLTTFEEQCKFVIDNNCLGDYSFIDYVYLLYCVVHYDLLGSSILFAILLLLFIALSTANQHLCPNLLSVAKVIGISESLAGVTLLAFGNGCPEIFSSLAAAQADRPDMIVGELIGGGIACTSIVSGVIFIGYKFELARRPMLRDSIFYLIASYCVWLTCYYGRVDFIHAIAFILLYVIYLTVALAGQAIHKRQVANKRHKQLERNNENGTMNVTTMKDNEIVDSGGERSQQQQGISVISNANMAPSNGEKCAIQLECDNEAPKSGHNQSQVDVDVQHDKTSSDLSELLRHLCPIELDGWTETGMAKKVYKLIKAPIKLTMLLTIPVVDFDTSLNGWSRLLNSLHCILVPLTVTILTKTAHNATILMAPMYIVATIIGLVASLVVFNTSQRDKPPKYHWAYACVGFVMSIIWVYYIAEQIVDVLKTVGLMLSMSDTVIGLGILAWGNSLGDLFANLTLANSGHCRLALGACIGAPLLNLLLGFGLSFGLYLGPGGSIQVTYTPTLAVLYFTLTTILFVLMLSTLMPPNWSRKAYGYLLLSLYVVYILLEGAIEYNYIKLF